LLDSIYKILRLVYGDPRTRVAKIFILAGVALVTSAWWEPFVQAAAVKFLDFPPDKLNNADERIYWTGWALNAIGLFLYARSGASVFARSSHGLTVIEGGSGLFCDKQTVDGEVVPIKINRWQPESSYVLGGKKFRIEFEAQLFNDTDVQMVVKDPSVKIWGVDGIRNWHTNPRFELLNPDTGVWIQGDESRTIQIPVRSMVKLRIKIGLSIEYRGVESLDEMYDGAVAELILLVVNGKQLSFRLCTTSFFGSDQVVWPERCKYPVYNMRKLNADGLSAGKRPQDRRETDSRTPSLPNVE